MKRTIRCGDIKDKLVFHDPDNGCYWQGFTSVQGRLGVFIGEYGPSWDRFIVIKKVDDTTCDVIFPQMLLLDRFREPVLLGKDKLQETYTATISCKHPHTVHDPWCSGCCEYESYSYTDRFTPVDDDYLYHIVRIKHPSGRMNGRSIWWGAVCAKHCNLDNGLRDPTEYKMQVQRNQCRYASVVVLGVAKRRRAIRDALGLVARMVWAMKKKK